MDSPSIRGRFSLSTTNLTSPIAESTCLNGISSRSKFNWGEGTISSRSRNNSQSVVEQNSSMSKNLTSIPTKVSMSPSSRIDPRTYVDIHSNGLASRIVKYHDNSTRLNRSLSMTNLYNKPGQFPVVHLKKNEQQYKAKKIRNLSMTRIAAPEKSVFHGNTLSSILRSGSIVGLQKSDEEISRENRPILHPPPTENEMAPTRSVLEVLKEISRKRINSDEMDGTELTKKQCKDPEQDLGSNIIHRTQSKRQREITNSSNAQISPEQQVIKKRMCNYNNDIMSSLSSSMASVNKRKMLEIQKRTSFDAEALSASNTISTDYEISRKEKHRCVGNSETPNSVATTKNTQITSISSLSYQNSSETDGETRNGLVTRRASEPALSNTKPRLTLFNKDYDEVPVVVNNDNAESKEDGDLCGIQFVKPKKSSSISSGGSLLMEKTKKSKLALMLSGLKGELDEEDEVDTALPKQEQQKVVESSVTTQVTSASTSSTSSNSTSLFTTTTTLVATSQPSSIISKSVVEDAANKQTEVTPILSLTSNTVTSNTSTMSSGFKINSAPVLSTSSTDVAKVTIPGIATSTSLSSITSTAASNPITGGFSFGLSTPKTSTETTSSALAMPPTSTISQNKSLTLTSSAPVVVSETSSITGIKPFTFGSTNTQASVSSTPSFNFGAPTTASQTVASTKDPANISTFGSTLTKPKEPPAFGQPAASSLPTFSFGTLVEAKTTTNALTKETASPATSSVLTANFDSQKNTWSTQSNSTSGNTNSINSISAFGAGSLSTLPQSTTVLTSTNSTGGFSFSNSSTTEASKPLFGNIATTNATSISSNTTFSFSANKSAPNQANTTSTFTFGAGASASPAVTAATAPNTALTFGATVPAGTANNNPQNVFGNTSNPNPKPSNTFAFGSSAASVPSQNGVFAFSSTEKTPTAAPTPATSAGGFSFNNPSVNFVPVAETNKNVFGNAAPAAAETKPAFNFGSSTTDPSSNKPAVFGGTTNIFGANTTSSAPQSSAFTFGSFSSGTANQGQTAPNPFAPAPSSNITGSVGAPTASSSIFGAPSAAVAPLAQSPTFNFGSSSSNAKPEASKPTGGFVFGSTSSIGSNASKPAVDMNKTFVFGDGNTIIKPAPSSSVFGGSNGTSNGINGGGATENKMFSFGSTAAGSNNTFAAGSQTVNPAPAFNFGGGAAPTNNAAPASNGNLFAQPGQPSADVRPFKKATRRLHKT